MIFRRSIRVRYYINTVLPICQWASLQPPSNRFTRGESSILINSSTDPPGRLSSNWKIILDIAHVSFQLAGYDERFRLTGLDRLLFSNGTHTSRSSRLSTGELILITAMACTTFVDLFTPSWGPWPKRQRDNRVRLVIRTISSMT